MSTIGSDGVRAVQPADVSEMQKIVDEALFPGDLQPAMIDPFFTDSACTGIWLVYELDATPVAVAYCVEEKMTDGTWNLLAIAVRADLRSRGIGRDIVAHLETRLTATGARILIVDTSSLPEYKRTREFYRRLGYVEEARIREFWAPGDDKVTFSRKLSAPA